VKKLLIMMLLSVISVFGTSFDCAKAKTYVEKMICSDEKLIEKDDQLNHFFKTLKISNRLSSDVMQSQKEWLKNRNRCKDLDCLHDSYNHQLEYLESKIEYQFATDQKESCSQFVEIFNNNLDVIRHSDFSASTAEYNGLKWLQPKVDMEHGTAIYGDVDINNDGKKEFVVGHLYSDIGSNYGIDYYASKNDYVNKKYSVAFEPSIDVYKFMNPDFISHVQIKKIYSQNPAMPSPPYGIGLAYAHVTLFNYKNTSFVLTEGNIGGSTDNRYIDNLFNGGDLFVVSKFDQNNQQKDMCLIYKILK
jgi:uncharacterized protein